MRRSRASGGARSSPDTVSARGLMVVGYSVDAALAQLRRSQLRWPDGRVAHSWPARGTVDTIAYAPFESRDTVLVRVRQVHRMAPDDVIELEVTAAGADRAAAGRAQTDHLQVVTDLALQVANHLEGRAVAHRSAASRADLVSS